MSKMAWFEAVRDVAVLLQKFSDPEEFDPTDVTLTKSQQSISSLHPVNNSNRHQLVLYQLGVIRKLRIHI